MLAFLLTFFSFAAHGFFDFALGRSFGVGIPFVVEFFSTGQCQFHFGPTPFEIDLQRDDRQTLLLRLSQKTLDLTFPEKEFSLPGGIMIEDIPVAVRTDMTIIEKNLLFFNHREAVFEVDPPLTERLDLGSSQGDAGLEGLFDKKIVEGLSIGDNDCVPVFFIRHRLQIYKIDFILSPLYHRFMLKTFSSISPVLKGLAQTFGWEKGIASAMLETRWNEIVGDAIASHTHPEEIRFDTLTILVDSAVWMHELSFLKKALIEKVNRLLGKNGIRKIQFKIGPVAPRPAPTQESRSLPGEMGEEEAALLNQLLLPVSDDDLKKTIQRAIRKHLLIKKEREDPGS